MSSSESDEFEVIDQLEASLSPAELTRLQEWLQPTDYEAQSSEFNRHLSSQAPGTGLWICETSKCQEWQDSSEHGCLWIKGVPGAGKSVTAASMIQHLQKSDGTPVLYFFFRYIISANRRPRSLVRDFLAQLLPYSVRLQATLQPLTVNPLDDLSDERLWEHLLIGLSSVEKAYCVVDALDEMELNPGDGFLERLNSLATFRPGSVKLLMTSRPKQYLQSSLKDASIVHIRLEDDLVGKDISLFLSYRLKNLLPNEDQQPLRESLATLISERADGLFLYARLLLDQITPSLSSPQLDIEKLVKDLPIGLEEMYNSMLFQQATYLQIDTQIQVFLLELATHSSRALRLNEIANALASTFPPSMIPDNPKIIAKSACAPLLEILEDETVSVIHHSFTEFLLNRDRANVGVLRNTTEVPQFPVIDPNKVHKRLSIICMEYLRAGGLRVYSEDVKSGTAVDSAEISAFFGKEEEESDGYNYQEAKLRYPFLEYAVGNWAFHASKYDVDDDEFFKSMAGFMDPESADFKKWLKLEWMKGVKSSEIQAPTPLHIAAFAGLTTYATKLLKAGASVDPRDAEDRTPLHWACARGNTSMVALLLQNNAIPDPEDTYGVKPIHEAARKNHAEIVRILLVAGVDPLTPKTKENFKHIGRCGDVSTKGETAVEYVWLQGHVDTILVMVPFLTPKTLEKLFCQCCRYGKFEAVRALFKAADVSPNSKMSGATALYLACRAHSVGVVELLLAKGADVHQASEWKVKNRNYCGSRFRIEPSRLPIHGLIVGWNAANNLACQKILRLLLSAGTRINSVKDENGDTPLLGLFNDRNSTDGVFVVVQSLLQAGADCLALDGDGDSVIHRLLRGARDIKTLKLLFEYGVPANILGKDDDTILHTALSGHSRGRNVTMEDVVNILLEKGAPCDLKNKHGVTAVEIAAANSECSLELFTLLARACADVDALQRCLFKITAGREKRDTPALIRVLQKFGVNLEDRDGEGRTALIKSTDSKELFEAFLKCGANPKAVDYKGRGVLYHFISSRPHDQPHEALQRLVDMVDMGLDPLQIDHEGNNLLHARARIYNCDELDDLFVQKILDYGISVNSKNNKGMTPLHIHLDNWDPSCKRNAVRQSLDERFYERHEITLLNLFRRNKKFVDINAQDSDGLTLFHLAAMRCETRMAYFLEQGADPFVLTKHRRNALHLACGARQSNVVGYICENYPDMVNQQDQYGRTPLHAASTSGQPESVRLLLKAGADVTIVDQNQRSPLHSCAEFVNEQKIWDVLSHPDEASGQVLQDRFRPTSKIGPTYYTMYARRHHARSERVKDGPNIGSVVKLLVAALSNAMATDSHGQTPLDLAFHYGCQDMIQELQFTVPDLIMRCGTKLDEEKLRTLLALKKLDGASLAKLNPDEPALQRVLNNVSTYLPFLTLEDVDWVSKNGGNITGADEGKPLLSSGQSLLYISASRGFTPLMEGFGALARVNDDPKVVLARIREQVSVDPKYRPEMEDLAPTLHVACSRELPNMDMVELLVEKCGVDINARAVAESRRYAPIAESVEGGTALHVLAKAKYWWQLEALKYLLQKGAKIDAVNEKGETPLHIACTGTTFAAMNCEDDSYGYWRIEAVRLLLDSGADVSHIDNKGLSCLHKASSSPQIMKILLEHGADIHSGKLSPVFSAIQIQCLETLTILLDAGVSPNIVDPNTGNEGFQLHYKAKDTIRTALFAASFSNLHNQREKHSAPLVKLLIERGADAYAALNDKQILIHYVFENAQFEIISAFLDCASKVELDLNIRDSLGRTVFVAACDMVESVPGYRYKHWYPKERAPFLRTIDFGADPLVLDNEGRNALHHLLDNPAMENKAIIQFLAHDSAKVLLHGKDQNGFTPLDCALRLLRPVVVEAMIKLGIDLMTPDPTGATALHRIAEQCLLSKPRTSAIWDHRQEAEFTAGALALWKKFLALGGSINVRDNKGASPLFYFLSSGEKNKYGAPEDWCCHLQYFPTYFSEQVVKDLYLKAKNGSGENALHIIAKREKSKKPRKQEHDHEPTHNKELYQFFVRKGLNPLEEDGNGRSSLDVAAACEQKGILELFQYGK